MARTCPRTIALGAYVLGALERDERRELQDHLETCGTCRGELDRLAPLPGLLSRLSTHEAEGLARDSGAERGPASLTTSASDPRTGVQARAELTPRPWGTRVELTIVGVRPGGHCRLVARTIGGRAEVAATWRATSSGTADVPGAVAVPPGRLLALDVVGVGDRVLVRMPVSVD